jgi:hypothetical protein
VQVSALVLSILILIAMRQKGILVPPDSLQSRAKKNIRLECQIYGTIVAIKNHRLFQEKLCLEARDGSTQAERSTRQPKIMGLSPAPGTCGQYNKHFCYLIYQIL